MAEKVENLWQDIMKKMLGVSSEAEHFGASKSSHFIHLTDLELVCEEIVKVMLSNY